MQREIPTPVAVGIIVALLLVVGVLLYRFFVTGGVQSYGESVAKPAPGAPGTPMPGAPGGGAPMAPR
ncbi:MAG: hypothetical protein N2045_06795 [Fimbriimonadales bacterium]|jgi:hypothetical protein|nr:hypothetical protein [Armatimonadota bacterium]MCX7687659.1 hypothetical protein [Fimbriimonadales bacterium]CUU08539.1 hypothetical protein GBSOP10_105516 [Armatimonadetes bacterium GBS]CUU35153.1 hypothetical protein DCOP10_11444 [Armatimonadetes bacterium DC]CUU38247.1 hypothetical protein GXSOP10_13719 [Armatimonadetes bacterium GXS]